MLDLSNLDGVLRAIAPDDLGRFLAARGYSRRGAERGVAVYASDRGVFLVPQDRAAPRYSTVVRDILEYFVKPDFPVDDVVAQVVLPGHDVLRYRIRTPETAFGHLRLSYSGELLPALHDLFRFTAAGVHSRKLDYTHISRSAQAYADQCRFGQTEIGSFVVKVFCPTRPHGATDGADLGEPFGRATTRAVLENLEFLSSQEAADPSVPLPPALNRQVARAVQRLEPPTSLSTDVGVSVRFTPSEAGLLLPDPAKAQTGEVATAALSPLMYGQAKGVRDRLKKAEEFQAEVLRGYIITLHRDSPHPELEQRNEITLEARLPGGGKRNVRMRLFPKQYLQAMEWQAQNLLVDLDAVIDKRGSNWTVYELRRLRPVPKKGQSGVLFTE